MTEWCRIYGVTTSFVRRKMEQGYYLEEALKEKPMRPHRPIKKKKNRPSDGIELDVDGKHYYTLYSLAKEYGLDAGTVNARYHKGLRGLDLVKPTRRSKL